jgi:enediyne biosynthesis protein E4
VAVQLSRWIGGVALLGACGGGTADPAAVACTDPPRGPVMAQFADVTHDSGVDFQYETVDFKGGGLAVADLDGDGLPEIVAGRRTGGLALFRNLGSLRFQKVTDSGLDAEAVITAISAVDLDNDGDLDLVLAGPGVAYVMENQGDGTFRQAARFDDSGATEHVLPVDLDGDGRLDLYFSNYDLSYGSNTLNRMYLNRGGLQFAFAGTAGAGLSWSTSAFDFDGDGDQDLYVANDTLLADFGRPVSTSPSTSGLHADLLLRNDGPGPDGVPRFTDVAADMGMSMTTPRSSMGGLIGDFDDDGRLDLYIPNYGAKKLLLRDPAGGFVESAAMLGVDGIVRHNAVCPPGTENEDCLLLSWSAALSDFDLDGYDELLVVNGETEFGRPPPVLMFARGPELPYHEVSPDLGCLDARGLVVTDLDGDGDQDVVISQKEGPLMVYKNVGKPAPGMWLRVELHGQASNREGRGAVVTARLASGRSQTRIVGAGGIIHSSSPAEAFFGLGHDAVETLEVRWPSGRRTEVTRPPPGSLTLDEGSP